MKKLNLLLLAAFAAGTVSAAETLHLTFEKPQTITLENRKIEIPAGVDGWLVRGTKGLKLPARDLIGDAGSIVVRYKVGKRVEPKRSNRGILTLRCSSRNRAAMYLGGDSTTMTYYVGDYDKKLYHQSPTPIQFGAEHSSAFVWDGSSLQIYQDGKLQVDGKLPLPFKRPDAIHLGPFRDGYTAMEPWGDDVWYKELIVCNHALKPGEVAKASGVALKPAIETDPGFLAVPRNSAAAPKIDGDVSDAFWNHAASLPVPVSLYKPQESFKAPNGRFMLSADDKNLYLGMWYSIPAYNTISEGQLRTPEHEPEVWGTESFEFYIVLNGQRYRFGGNVAGGYTEGNAKGKAWSCPWQYKSTYKMLINDSHVWQAEAAIPWAAFGLDGKPEGDIPFNFCRTWGFTAYSGATALNPDGRYGITKDSPKLRFVANAPTAQLLLRNDPSRGTLSQKVALASVSGGTVRYEIAMLTADGASMPATVFAKDFALKPGEVKEIDIETKIPGSTCDVIRYTLMQNGKVAARELVPFKMNEIYLEAVPLFLSGKLNVTVQRAMASRKFNCDSFDLLLLSSEGKEISRTPVKTDTVTIPFDSKTLPGGRYQLALAGKEKNFVTQELNFPGFGEWARVKYDRTVILPPFTPMTAKGDSCAMWGRVYRFDKSIFPVSVKTQNVELFSAAPQIVANGSAAAQEKFTIRNAAPHRAEFSAAMKHPAFTAAAESFAEYDGIFYSKIHLVPNQALNELKLRFTLPASEVKYLHASGSSASWGSKITRTIPEGMSKIAFYPMVWIGREDRGICLFTETHKNWTGDKHAVWTIDKQGDTAVVEVNLRKALKANEPFDFEFGLIATPVKPHTKDFPLDILGCNHTAMMRRGTRAPVNYLSIFSGYGMGLGRTFADLPSPEANKDKLLNAEQMIWRSKVHNKIAAYMLSRYITDEYPEVAAYKEEWSNSPCGILTSKSDGKDVTIYECCMTTSALDFYSWHLKNYIERSKTDAIYYDFGTFGPCSNRLHGCEDHYPILAMREFHRRTALLLYQSGVKEPMVVLHNTDSVQLPAITFATHLFNGEHVRQASSNLLHDGKDIQDSYDISMFACELSSLPFGLTNTVYNPVDPLLPQNGRTKEPTDIYRFRVTQAFLAATLPHGTIVAQNRSHYGILDKIVRIYEKFDAHNAEFIGYWDKPAQVSGSDTVKVSVYRHAKEKRALAVIAHVGKAHKNQNFTVAFDAAKLGFTPKKAVDLMTAPDPEYMELYKLRGRNHIAPVRAPLDCGDFGSKVESCADGKLTMSLKYHTFAIVELSE